jgi:transposase
MMNNEEFDRKMEFIVNQQAKFDANMQELQEAQKITEQNLNRFVENTKEDLAQTKETLAELTTLTTEGFKWTIQRFNAIAENSKHTDAKIDALIDSQIRTDAMIRNLDAKIDHHISEDHNSA